MPADADVPQNPAHAALIAAIAERRKSDPLIGARVAGKEIVEQLTSGLKNERGVHCESLLCALGALAGYSCQAGLRAQAVARGEPPDAPFVVIGTQEGGSFLAGDALNAPLAESQYSVWSLAAGGAQQAGAKELPDILEIFRRCAASIGTDEFGVPAKIEGHSAGDLPINYLRAIWPSLLPMVRDITGDPALWSVAYGVAIQETLSLTKDVLPPALGLRIVMEAAIPMSKVKL